MPRLEPGAHRPTSFRVLPEPALHPGAPRAPRQGRSPGGSPRSERTVRRPIPAAVASPLPKRRRCCRRRPGPKPKVRLPNEGPRPLIRPMQVRPKPAPASGRRVGNRGFPSFRPTFRRASRRKILGASRSLPSAFARASPSRPQYGGFVSRPALRVAAASSGGTGGVFAWAVAGKALDLSVDRLCHEPKALMDAESRQADSACG
jgi:hypothetical protein